MRILFIAPQPFYEDRGTPIVVRDTLISLNELGFQIDLATFPVGSEVNLPGIRIIRTTNPFRYRSVRIGLSFRKIVLDICLFITVFRLAFQNRYDYLHGVEEGAAIALLCKALFGIPVIYDMQSSMPEQLKKTRGFKAGPGRRLSLQFERWLIRKADCIIASQGLALHVNLIEPQKMVLECIFDGHDPRPRDENLAKSLGTSGRPTVVYAGNFAPYQGLEYLIEAAALVRAEIPDAIFILVGGIESDIDRLRKLIEQYKLAENVKMLRRKPWNEMPDFIALADALVLSRTSGENVPLKIFDYLKSGKPIVATDIPAHRKLLSDKTAILVAPTPDALSEGILYALQNIDHAEKLAAAAQISLQNEEIKPLKQTLAEAYRSVRGTDAKPIHISVIIPAHNAAETVSAALESLLSQTFRMWEAIVIDDGSTDETAAIAGDYAKFDSRIRVVSQSQKGHSAARNMGISLARYDWLLFLDADDLILPKHLERTTDALAHQPGLDAVHCGWTRITADGEPGVERFCHQSGDLFDWFAHANAFATTGICVIRRALVEVVGGFDAALRSCADWDLWQRIARTGANFGAVREVLVRYRMRPDSVSTNVRQLFADGLRVAIQGHRADRRVRKPDPFHVDGLPAEKLPGAKIRWSCWPAGLLLGRNEDAHWLLDEIKGNQDPELDPDFVANVIFEAVTSATCRTAADWVELWPSRHQPISEFLHALEVQTKAHGLAQRVMANLEGLVIESAMTQEPLTIGGSYAIRIELTEPLPEIKPPASVERLKCDAYMNGERLGLIELPVVDRLVSSHLIADAIATEFAWPIIGQFFEQTVYRNLQTKQNSNGLSIWRGDLCLAEELPEKVRENWMEMHDRIGWTVFLQEIWGRPDRSHGHFYDPQIKQVTEAQRSLKSDRLVVEISEEFTDVNASDRQIEVVMLVGGSVSGTFPIRVEQGVLQARELRAALTAASGYELCRVAVREGLLGRPFTEAGSLRERLFNAAKAAKLTSI
jgi:glycosyltransferase involved in cell wall biosynthesis